MMQKYSELLLLFERSFSLLKKTSITAAIRTGATPIAITCIPSSDAQAVKITAAKVMIISFVTLFFSRLSLNLRNKASITQIMKTQML